MVSFVTQSTTGSTNCNQLDVIYTHNLTFILPVTKLVEIRAVYGT